MYDAARKLDFAAEIIIHECPFTIYRCMQSDDNDMSEYALLLLILQMTSVKCGDKTMTISILAW